MARAGTQPPPLSLIAYRFAGSRQDAVDVVVYLALVRADRVTNAYDRVLAERFKGEGRWLSAANSFTCVLALTRGKELLEERRNVAVGECAGYDGHRLGDDCGGCSNCEAPGRANNDAFERFIGVGVIDQIPRGA